MEIRPMYERVVVKRLEAERQGAGAVVIPDPAAEKHDRGVVIAVSTGRILDSGMVRPNAVKVGDRVMFGKYAGHPVKFHGDEIIVMREEDIMAIA